MDKISFYLYFYLYCKPIYRHFKCLEINEKVARFVLLLFCLFSHLKIQTCYKSI